MEHQMRLHPEPFHRIKSGKKTIELRLYDEKRRLVSVGDMIEFINTDAVCDSVKTKVTALHIYENFASLYTGLSLVKCGYEEAEIKNASPLDMNKYYSLDKQAKYGVVGIEITLLSQQSSF